jgi:hypothetical protein
VTTCDIECHDVTFTNVPHIISNFHPIIHRNPPRSVATGLADFV